MSNITPITDAKRQEALAALERAREEGRAQWRPYVADAVSAAVKEAVAPLKDQFDANITELRAFHAQHMKAHGGSMLFLGAVISSAVWVCIAAGVGYASWSLAKDAQLTNAAARGIEQRGGQDVLSAPRMCVPGVDEDCLPDTVSRDSGYARPGREPASAR